MKPANLVIVKDGDYKVNIFHDVMELVNNENDIEFKEGLVCRTRMDIKMRLQRNTSSFEQDKHLVLTHYAVDLNHENTTEDMLVGVDTELMMAALDDGYEFVIFGSPTQNENMIPEHALLPSAIYIVRDDTGHLINYVSKERLVSDEDIVDSGEDTVDKQCVAYVCMTKPADFPLYYLVTDPSIVSVTDGIDGTVETDTKDTHFRKINPQDGTIKESIMVPRFSSNAKVIGKHNVFAAGTFTIGFFGPLDDIIGAYKDVFDASAITLQVDTNLPMKQLEPHKFAFDPDSAKTGYIRIGVANGGRLNDIIRYNESLVYEYVVMHE